MKLKYQTAIATLVQFVSLTLLNVVTGTVSVVTGCHNNSNCAGNLLTSLVFFLLVSIWFGCIWLLGYAAQEQRSKRLARVLIIAELLVALVALFNIKHHGSLLSLLTSLSDLGLSAWVITLAYRLMKAGGGRIVIKQRSRDRHKSSPDKTI